MFLKSSFVLIPAALFLGTSCSEIDKQLEISENRDIEAEIRKEADMGPQLSNLSPEELAARRAKMAENRTKLEERRLKLEMENQLAAEKRSAQRNALTEAQLKAKIAKEKLQAEADLLALKIEEEKAAAERAAEEKLQAEVAELKKKEEAQKIAWGSFIGTKYETLNLKNGKTLKDAKVTEVRATHVTFVHSSGIANVKFENLTYAIRRICKYDPKLAEVSRKKQIELQRNIKARMAAEKIAENDQLIASEKSAKRLKQFESTYKPVQGNSSTATNYDNVVPKGIVSVKTVAVSNNGSSRYNGTSKTIQVTAISNVPATLTTNSGSHTLTPNVKFVTSFKTYYGKYSVTIRDKKGNILDQETHSRKTGL